MGGPMGGADPMMGNDPMGGADPMAGNETAGGNDPMNDSDPMGDGADNQSQDSDQQELDDIFNSASIETKNAILKYAKSQSKNDNGNDSNEEYSQEPMPEMPMESRKYHNKLVNEIVNGIIGDLDMNDREGVKGTKRDEKKITNKRVKRNNPFVAGR